MPRKKSGGGSPGRSGSTASSGTFKLGTEVMNVVREVEKSVLPRIVEMAQGETESKGDRCRATAASYWEQRSDRETVAADMVKIVNKALEIVKSEPRCLKVHSPVYIFGDIHGNLLDLMSYEKILWPDREPLPNASYLFLGDYVDRGYFSLECFIYLCACKVLWPQSYFLVRGNHEERAVQRNYSFFAECIAKFGNNIGNQIWEACAKVCDSLPLCAVVDETVFCCHGGIPRSTIRLDDINQIPNVLSDPLRQSAIAWELLWNDPLPSPDFDQQANVSGPTPDDYQRGFIPNRLRGAGFYFNEVAVDTFFAANGLTHCIRGHQTPRDGYDVQMNGKVITVFSSSSYSDNNPASVMLVGPEEILCLIMDPAPSGQRTGSTLKMTAIFHLPKNLQHA